MSAKHFKRTKNIYAGLMRLITIKFENYEGKTTTCPQDQQKAWFKKFIRLYSIRMY